jgi:hypothetical protein
MDARRIRRVLAEHRTELIEGLSRGQHLHVEEEEALGRREQEDLDDPEPARPGQRPERLDEGRRVGPQLRDQHDIDPVGHRGKIRKMRRPALPWGRAMKRPPVDPFYLWIFLGFLATFGPPVSCARSTRKDLKELDALRQHQRTADPRQRELIVGGRMRGGSMAEKPRVSPTGRGCLAWRHEILANRQSGSGKNKTTVRTTICSKQDRGALFLDTPEGESFSVPHLSLRLRAHPTQGQAASPLIPCPGLTEADRKNATFTEYCLLDGDEAEAWACRGAAGSLVSCGDLGDYLAAPPDDGPIEPQRKQATSPLCFGSVWLLVGTIMLLIFLHERVVSTRRSGTKKKEAD